MNDKLRLVHSYEETSARKALAAYIGGKEVVPRPFNLSKSEPWTTSQQINWAILQVKHAFRIHSTGDFKDISFSRNDPVATSSQPAFIELPTTGLSEPKVLKDPVLFKLSLKAFAEVAGENPDRVTTCLGLRKGFFISALNLFAVPICVATDDESVKDRLVDFANNAKFAGGMTRQEMIFTQK